MTHSNACPMTHSNACPAICGYCLFCCIRYRCIRYRHSHQRASSIIRLQLIRSLPLAESSSVGPTHNCSDPRVVMIVPQYNTNYTSSIYLSANYYLLLIWHYVLLSFLLYLALTIKGLRTSLSCFDYEASSHHVHYSSTFLIPFSILFPSYLILSSWFHPYRLPLPFTSLILSSSVFSI